MPDQIGQAISGVATPIGNFASNAWNGVTNDASSLYNALPSPSAIFGGSAPASTPASGVSPGPQTSGPITTTNLPGGNTPLPANTNSLASTTTNPSGAAPAAATPAPSAATTFGNLAKTIGGAVEMYQRYQHQQNLQNPNWVASQIAKLQQPLGRNLKNEIGTGVQAQMQEAGLGQAPGLFRQALAQALAPYQVQAQANAENEFNAATNESEGAYPVGGGLDDFGKVLQDLYGGGQ